MTVVTTRPNATILNTGFTVTGAANAQTALSDNSDASYLQFPGTIPLAEITVGFAEPAALPAGAVYKQDRIWARVSRVTPDNSPMRMVVLSAWPRGLAGDQYDADSIDIANQSVVKMALLTATDTGARSDLVVDLYLALFNAGGIGFLYELYWDSIYVLKPVVDSVTVSPVSPISNDDTPTIKWTTPELDPDGGAQTRYQVRTFTAAQYGAGGFDPATSAATEDSGVVTSAAKLYTIGEKLADATYRSYVRMGQTVNGATHWSDYSFVQYTLAVDRPAIPTIAVTPENGSGRIKVRPNNPGGGAVSTDFFLVQRSLDGGTTWEYIRTLNALALIGVGVDAYDYEVPNGYSVKYRAKAIHSFPSGTTSASNWVTSGSFSWSSNDYWLKSPTRPDLNMSVRVHSYPEIPRAARQSVKQPLGADFPIVVGDGTRSKPAGEISFRMDAQSEIDDLNDLLDTVQPLLVQMPDDANWPDRWVVLGDDTEAKVEEKMKESKTIKTLGWTEVDVPTDQLVTWE